jgi:hypothetical protein
LWQRVGLQAGCGLNIFFSHRPPIASAGNLLDIHTQLAGQAPRTGAGRRFGSGPLRRRWLGGSFNLRGRIGLLQWSTSGGKRFIRFAQIAKPLTDYDYLAWLRRVCGESQNTTVERLHFLGCLVALQLEQRISFLDQFPFLFEPLGKGPFVH